jgi:hypothetical protein
LKNRLSKKFRGIFRGKWFSAEKKCTKNWPLVKSREVVTSAKKWKVRSQRKGTDDNSGLVKTSPISYGRNFRIKINPGQKM